MRDHYFISLFLFAFVLSSCATTSKAPPSVQQSKPSNAEKLLEKVLKLEKEEKISEALAQLESLTEAYPQFQEAHLKKAFMLYDRQQYDDSIDAFQKAIVIDPEHDKRMYLSLATVARESDQFALAAKQYAEYLRRLKIEGKTDDRIEKFEANMNFAARAVEQPVPFNPKPMDGLINTKNPEYLASFTADEQTMIFTRQIQNQEDFYIAHFSNGVLVSVEALDELNTPLSEGAHTISADGNEIIFTVCEDRVTFGGCDLYTAKKVNGSWGKAKNLGPDFNTEQWDAQPALSGDGQSLYFSSNRGGGLGKSDIWISKRKADDSWAAPVNAGPIINTPNNDEAPYIHKDNLTMYFRSDGHIGMGGFDLFMSKRAYVNTAWSQPKNLGYPINTSNNEGALSLNLVGDVAYYASDRNQENATDIFTFSMPESLRPRRTTYLSFTVVDAETNQAINSKITLQALSHEQETIELKVDQNGKRVIPLPTGQNYGITVDQPGYIFYSEYVALDSSSIEMKPKSFEVRLQKIPIEHTVVKAEPIVLHNIYFETGSAALLAASDAEISRLYSLLKENPSMHIQILGHTDNVGNDQDNMRLSLERAKSVYNALIQKGISSNRLQFLGKGESQPLVENDTNEGRQRNRRTEFVITKT